MATHRRYRTLEESKEEEQVETNLSNKCELVRSRTTSINSPFGAESGYMTSESRSATLESPLLSEVSGSTLTRETAKLISTNRSAAPSMGASATAGEGVMLDNFCEHEDDLSEGMFAMSLEDISANIASSSANDSYSPVPWNFNNTPPPGALRLNTHGRLSEASQQECFSEPNSSFVSLFQRHAATQTSGLLRRSLRTRPASAPLYEELSPDVDDHNIEDDLRPFVIDNGSDYSAVNRGAASAVGWDLGDEDSDMDYHADRSMTDPLPDLLPPMRARSISVPIFESAGAARTLRSTTSGTAHIRVAAIQLRQLGDEFQLSHSPERRSLSTTVFPLSFSSWRSLTRVTSTSGANPTTAAANTLHQESFAQSWTQEMADLDRDARNRRRPSLPLAGSSYPGSTSLSTLFDGFMHVVSNLTSRGTSESSERDLSGHRRSGHRQQFHSESTEN